MKDLLMKPSPWQEGNHNEDPMRLVSNPTIFHTLLFLKETRVLTYHAVKATISC